MNSGQTCIAWTRMLVPASQQGRDRRRGQGEVAETLHGRRPDRPEQSKLGPLISDTQRERVRGYIKKGIDEGAELVTGGAEAPEGLDKGYFVKPTVFAERHATT